MKIYLHHAKRMLRISAAAPHKSEKLLADGYWKFARIAEVISSVQNLICIRSVIRQIFSFLQNAVNICN